MKNYFRYAVILLATLVSCTSASQQKQAKTAQKSHPAGTAGTGKHVSELQLKDSGQLVHVKNQFYRSRWGQLFQKTGAQREAKGVDTPLFVAYFDGTLPQDLDPLTFKMLKGWYAKDKNFVCSYRPTSGGMFCIKIDGADYSTFRMLKGESFLAADKNHLYDQGGLIDSINPANMKITRDKHGWAVKIVSDGHVYEP